MLILKNLGFLTPKLVLWHHGLPNSIASGIKLMFSKISALSFTICMTLEMSLTSGTLVFA